MPDNLFRGVTFDSFGAGIPTDNLAQRVQHKNRIVVYPIQQHAILFFAIPERSLGSPARGVVAMGAPAGCAGDQQAQSGSEDQYRLGLAQAPLGLCGAQDQQPKLLALQLTNYGEKLVRGSLDRPASSGSRCQTLFLAQTNDLLRALYLLSSQVFKLRNLPLLFRVVQRQVANSCLVLRDL